MYNIKGKVAIVGIGMTHFTKDSGRTEHYMACEAIKAAVEDAGICMNDIDGMVHDRSDPIDSLYLTKAIGIDNIAWESSSRWGTIPMMHACIAVACGATNCVLYHRSVNGSSKRRALPDLLGAPEFRIDTLESIRSDFYAPFGLVSPTGRIAMIVRRYMHEFGVERKHFWGVVAACRAHAAKNPAALFYQKPITMDQYLGSEMIVDPLCELDCAPEIDGAVAVIVTTSERAKGLKQKPVYIQSVAMGTATEGQDLSSYSRNTISDLPEMHYLGETLFARAGIAQKDVGVVQLDDTFAPLVPMQLEALGFCQPGEGALFCQEANRCMVEGALPINTSGGSLGEGHIYGINHVVEAVRQIRGTAVNQVANPELILVANGAGGPADGMILGGDK